MTLVILNEIKEMMNEDVVREDIVEYIDNKIKYVNTKIIDCDKTSNYIENLVKELK